MTILVGLVGAKTLYRVSLSSAEKEEPLSGRRLALEGVGMNGLYELMRHGHDVLRGEQVPLYICRRFGEVPKGMPVHTATMIERPTLETVGDV